MLMALVLVGVMLVGTCVVVDFVLVGVVVVVVANFSSQYSRAHACLSLFVHALDFFFLAFFAADLFLKISAQVLAA